MTVLQKFVEARKTECQASGAVPCVAVMGYDDFDTLCGEMHALFGLHVDTAEKISHEKLKKAEYEGVMIFRSSSLRHGIFIASPIQ